MLKGDACIIIKKVMEQLRHGAHQARVCFVMMAGVKMSGLLLAENKEIGSENRFFSLCWPDGQKCATMALG